MYRNQLWVANNSGDSVTELNASTGALVKLFSAQSYGFNGPFAVAVDGTHVFVANHFGDSVTEFRVSQRSDETVPTRH